MTQEQTLELIPVDQLVERVRSLRDQGCRFIQIGATRLPEEVELTYSFEVPSRVTNLRLKLPSAEPRVPSISSIYACVVLYENELHDLFRIQIDGMAVDFHGHLYRTTVKYPFGTIKAPAKAVTAPAKPVSAPASPTVPT